MDCHARSTLGRSVRSRSVRLNPRTSQPGAHRGAVLTRYCPINPTAPVMIARGAMLGGLLTCQLAVPNPVRLIGFFAQAFLPIRLVFAVVPLEPDDFAVAFEGQDVRRDAIEEPAIVAADDRAAGKTFEPLFQRA